MRGGWTRSLSKKLYIPVIDEHEKAGLEAALLAGALAGTGNEMPRPIRRDYISALIMAKTKKT